MPARAFTIISRARSTLRVRNPMHGALRALGCGVLLAGGCAVEVGEDEAAAARDAADNATALSALFREDFEAAASGPLAAPWLVSSAGATRASVVATSDRGQALRVRASAVAGDFLIASRELPAIAGDVSVQFAVRPARGASLVFMLSGTGSGYASRQLRLLRAPGSGTLVAGSASGNVECGALPTDQRSTVTLDVRASEPRSFDVRIDGEATRCSELATRLGLPATSFGVMDASNEDWGGDVYLGRFRGAMIRRK